MYNPLTVVVKFDHPNTSVCRRSMAFRRNSLHYQIHMNRQGNDDNSRLALKVMGSHKSMEGIPSSNSQIHHTRKTIEYNQGLKQEVSSLTKHSQVWH